MPNISLRTPHRAKKATSVSSDRAAPPSASRTAAHPPGRWKRTSAPGKKNAEQSAAPPLLSLDSLLFFRRYFAHACAHARNARIRRFSFFTFTSSPTPRNHLLLCELGVKALLRGASPLLHPDFCTKSPCRNDLHRTFSHGELCMNVNASPFCRRSAVRFNGLARAGEG